MSDNDLKQREATDAEIRDLILTLWDKAATAHGDYDKKQWQQLRAQLATRGIYV